MQSLLPIASDDTGIDHPPDRPREQLINDIFDRLLFKMYRKLEEGINPEPEILRFLAGRKKFRNAPAYAGKIEYHAGGNKVYDIGVLQSYIACLQKITGRRLSAMKSRIQKVVQEMGYELNNRPEHVGIHLRGIEALLRECRCS